MATPETSALSVPNIESEIPLITFILFAAFIAILSKPVGIWFGCIFAGAVDPLLYSSTKPVSAPCSSKSSAVMPDKEPPSITHPLFAVVLTMCNSWLDILLSCSCGESKFLTIPKGLPLLK